MFEIGQGLGPEWQAPGALRLEPQLGSRHDARHSHSWKRRAPFWILAFVLLGAGGLWCRLSFIPAAGASGWRAELDGVARLTGFGIDMVVLTGHRFTADSDIFDALDLPNARSLVSFDTQGVRRRLERLPWVQTAELTRVFPDRLDVRVSERRAFAVWERDGQSQLIDDSGRVLSTIGNSRMVDLPRVTGEGAASVAQPLFEVIGRVPAIKARLQSAERIGERRWTLHLSGGVTVHLPPGREALQD